MATSHKRLASAVAVTLALLVSGTSVNPVSAAEEAVLIPGATVFKQINPIYPIIATTYPKIGVNFHDDDDPQVVDYSQNALASDRAISDGVKKADAAVRATDGKVVVIGESMGSMVAARLAAELADSPDPPSPNDIRFVLIAPPEEGVAQYFKEGTYIPLLNYRVSRTPKSPYPTTVVIGEYDGWADPPDRPWNFISSANAVLGIVYVHGPAMWPVDPADVPPENTTIDGTVTTHLVPTEHLPLTRPFRDFGVPGSLVDAADRILRPVVDAGYRRHDKPGDTRPYLADGRSQRNVQSAQQTREQSRQEDENEQEPGAKPGQQGQGADKQGSTNDSAAETEQQAGSDQPGDGVAH